MTENAMTNAQNHLPGVAGLAAGLRRTRQAMPSFGGKGYLSFGKDGNWTLGQDKRTSRNGETAVLNINTLKSGFVCWTNHDAASRKKNEKLGEEMRLATMQPIDPSTLPDLGWEWRQQQSIEGRFTGGDTEEFNFTTSSLGGLELMDGLLDDVLKRIDEGEDVYLFPIVVLEDDWYEHKQYGKTYKPVLRIEGWADVEGVPEGATKQTKAVTAAPSDDPAEEPASDEAPVRRRRR